MDTILSWRPLSANHLGDCDPVFTLGTWNNCSWGTIKVIGDWDSSRARALDDTEKIGLPAEVRKSFVGFGHFVDVVTLFDSATLARGSVDYLGGKFFCKGMVLFVIPGLGILD